MEVSEGVQSGPLFLSIVASRTGQAWQGLGEILELGQPGLCRRERRCCRSEDGVLLLIATARGLWLLYCYGGLLFSTFLLLTTPPSCRRPPGPSPAS